MKKFILLILSLLFISPSYAWYWDEASREEKAVRNVIKSQVRYANRCDLKKFISTFDDKYTNSDGFDLNTYSSLVKELWKSFDNIEYEVEIKEIQISGNNAEVKLCEKSFAELSMTKAYEGILKSESNSIYKLEKKKSGWKVVSDTVLDETTSMLYGKARELEVSLTVPKEISANTDYCASLEFVPPKETIAIASIASDIVEYPQKPAKEVFRALPEDNILERLFTSNNKELNEYVVASIGLTQPVVCESNLNLSLTGFGYVIKRVNVVPSHRGNNDKFE